MTRPAFPHHRPRYHLSLPQGFLNDPNGPIWLDGTAHMYFQSRPYANTAVPVQWGHATSTDLVHWTLARPAMSPVPGGPDADGCWSGNTIIDGDRVRAYYSGKTAGSPYQPILTAVSDAQGTNFGAPVAAVPAPPAGDGVTMFRDPFVWRDGDGWSMAVGAAVAGDIAAIRGYRSDDGLHWRSTGDLARLARTVIGGHDTGQGWECPQVLRLGQTRVAVVSAWSHDGGGSKVLAFDMDAAPAPRPVDDGSSFYAASAMQQPGQDAVLFGWITEGRTAQRWQEEGWAGAISLPRRPEWSDGTLRTRPHPAVEGLRSGPARPADGTRIGGQVEITLPEPGGQVHIRFQDGEALHVTADDDSVHVDRTSASLDSCADRDVLTIASAFDDDAGLPAVRMFLDGSVLEMFTSAGRALTTRVYPTAPPAWSVAAPAAALAWDLV